MFNDKLQVLLLSGLYKRGEPYPDIDFSEVQAQGITNKEKYIACNNEELRQQIEQRLNENPSVNEVPYFFYKVLDSESSGNDLTKTFINDNTGEADDGFGNKWKDHVARIANAAKNRKDNPIMLKKDVDLQQLISENVEYTDPVTYLCKYMNDLYDNNDIDENQNILGKKQK